MLVVCIDYSGDRIKVYDVIIVREENLKVLSKFLPLFPHYSEIKVKFTKTKLLKLFPKRYERVKNYIEKLIVSNNLQEIMNELKKLKS